MIKHIIHFYQKGFDYTWHLQLPYRLALGDLVHDELLENRGKLQYDKVIEDKFCELEYDDYLIVERLEIDHNANVVVWLNIPKE
ncbi:hypothetical protein G1K66_12550 [Tenacibaculum finnmarkense]|uniref:hypothetical protein n=1 Tax=Tenacibaculum finnmarkense TaxID=2781243 RepID=UPI001E34AE8B|nr:hypothetical protein [Tenacibaculum finnmarkense]MCD8401337.1 hypothetical protein [Tenacibaculum finnmarkense genomovar ulcerans]MCG8786468.1 hypothetical protein [Tenacibaculum finnmarkense]MCG8814086.1 hypothetical protein [Tenacibaculum finnmarkense]